MRGDPDHAIPHSIYLPLGWDCNVRNTFWNRPGKMTIRTIYDVFYSWFNWQQLQVNFKGHLSHHLLAKFHNIDIFPNYAFSACFHCLWVMLLGSEPVLAVSLSLRGSLHKKGAEKWRLNRGFVRWFVMVNVEALPSLRALPMCSINSTRVTCPGLSPELFWVWKLPWNH